MLQKQVQKLLSNSAGTTMGCLADVSTLEAPQQCVFRNTFSHSFTLSCTLLPFYAYWNIKRH